MPDCSPTSKAGVCESLAEAAEGGSLPTCVKQVECSQFGVNFFNLEAQRTPNSGCVRLSAQSCTMSTLLRRLHDNCPTAMHSALPKHSNKASKSTVAYTAFSQFTG